MEAFKTIRELLKSDSLSRSEISELIDDIETRLEEEKKLSSDTADELDDLKKENEKYQETIGDLEEREMTADNLLEQNLLDEFYNRFEALQKGSLNPNLILQNYKAL